MHITTLASGSSGNCTLVSADGTHILVDAGISMKRIAAGLGTRGLRPCDIDGVVVTHEHADHVCGLATMTKYHKIPIYAPRTVANYLRRTIAGVDDYLTAIVPGEPFGVGGARLRAFRTPHDAPESVGYRIEADISFGLCTDLGHVTDEVLDALVGVDAAVIESNHDEEMLRYGPYPYYLKRRILSDNGHLSNENAGQLAVQLAQGGAAHLVLGHLSKENNAPALALQTVSAALAAAGLTPVVSVAPAAELMTATVTKGAVSCSA
jgi:phosphoribosyl 1,2-cyclic phosphodiesterase